MKDLLFTDTGKDTVIVFTGTLVNVLFGGLFFIFVSRSLGPADLGLFTVVTATGLMAVNFANFALDTGILKFASPGGKQSTQVLSLAFKTYLVAGTAVFLLGLIFASPLAQVLGQPQIAGLLKIAFFGVIFILLTNFFTASLQSKKQFAKASIITVFGNLARLLLLVIGAYFFTIDLYFITLLYYFVIVISVILGKIFVPLDFSPQKNPKNLLKKFFGYNFWIAASVAISSIPIDDYLLVKISGPFQAGLFAAPMKIASVINQLAGDFTRVLAPRFASFDSDEKAKNYAKKAVPIVLFVCGGIVLSILIATPLILLLFTEQFLNSVGIYRILAVGSVLAFLTTIPVSIIVYYFGKSRAVFLITSADIFIWFLANIILIPKFAAIGAALAYLISTIASTSIFGIYMFWKFSKNGQR